MPDWKTVRKRLAEEVIPTCTAGDLLADHALLKRQIEEAEEVRGDGLSDNGVGELTERLKAVEAEIRENTYPFRFRAMGPKWRTFIDDRPPRRDENGEVHEDDASAGHNVEAVYNDIVRASLVDPDVSGDATWEEVASLLTDRQYEDFASAALRLNRGKISIPFSHAASKTNPDTGGE